jgi:hypothetical protein
MSKAFLLLLGFTVAAATAQVKLSKDGDRVDVEIDGKPFTTFYAGAETPKPYLHPLRTASGKRVSRGFPMEQVAGETRDHPHHRGLWFTHGDVNKFDFWMNEKSQRPGDTAKRGLIVLRKIDKVQDGKKQGVIHSVHEWQAPDAKPLLTEDRTMVFQGDATRRVVDIDVTFTAMEKVTFGDTKEGFFAIRLRDEMAERKGTGTMVSAEGQSKMANVWGKRSPWVDYSGTVEGEKLGIAILDHPGNPKHPTYWHSRDYGLFAANQFGEHDFLNDKTKDGSLTIEPGKKLRFRYRVIIHPGDAAEAKIAEEFKKYASGK